MFLNIFRFRRYSELEKKTYNSLKNLLGFSPGKLYYYRIAFRHSSASLSSRNKKINNERLEFIGDAVLNMVISDLLYKHMPEVNEGKLSLIRSKIVCRKNLNEIAISLNLHSLLICKNNPASALTNIPGNAFEALFGAVFYAKGYKYCKLLAQKHLLSADKLQSLSKDKEDYKSQIINLAQKNKLNIGFITHENCEANEKIQHFICELIIEDKYITFGKGWSKKEAEQECARKASENGFEKLLQIVNSD